MLFAEYPTTYRIYIMKNKIFCTHMHMYNCHRFIVCKSKMKSQSEMQPNTHNMLTSLCLTFIIRYLQ